MFLRVTQALKAFLGKMDQPVFVVSLEREAFQVLRYDISTRTIDVMFGNTRNNALILISLNLLLCLKMNAIGEQTSTIQHC